MTEQEETVKEQEIKSPIQAHVRGDSESTLTEEPSEKTDEAKSVSEAEIPKSERRYFNGRLSRRQYVFAVTVCSLLGFFAFALLITYTLVFRFVIPKIFWGIIFEGSWNGINVQDFILRNITDDGVTTKFYLQSRRLKLPVKWAYAELRPLNFTFYTAKNKRPIFRMAINDALNLNGWELLKLHMDPWELHFPDPENARQVVASFADYIVGANNTDTPFHPPFDIYIEGWSDVWLCGLPVYNVNLFRNQKLDFALAYNWIGRNVFGGISSLLDQNNYNNYLGSLGNLALSSNNEQLASDLRQLNSGSIGLDEFKLNVDKNGISLKASGKFLTEQVATFAFGPIDFKVKLNGQTVARLDITGLAISRENPNFDIKIDIVPMIEGDVNLIKSAIDAIAQGKLTGVTAGIKDLSIKAPNGEKVGWIETVLGGIDFDIELEAFQRQFFSISNPGGLMSSVGGALGFAGIKVELLRSNTVQITPKIALSEFFKPKVHIEKFVAKLASDNGTLLATLSVPEINLGPDVKSPASALITLKLETSDLAAEAAGQTIGPAILNTNSYLSIGNFVFGAGSNELQGLNTLFQVLRLRIPINKLIWGRGIEDEPTINIASANMKQQVFESVQDIPPAISLAVESASLKARATGLSLRVNAKIANRLPVDIIIPHIKIRTALDKMDLVSVGLQDFGLVNGTRALNSALNVDFGTDPRLPAVVGKLYRDFMNPDTRLNIKNVVSILGLEIGPSSTEFYPLFNKINLDIPGFTLALLPNLLNKPKPAVPDQEFKKPPVFQFSIAGKSNIDWIKLIPSIQSIGVSTLERTLVLDLDAAFGPNVPFTIDIPFMSLDLNLDNSRFADLSLIGLQLKQSTSRMQLRAFMGTGQLVEAKTAQWIKQLINSNMRISTLLGGIRFGESNDRSVKVLEGLSFKLPLGKAGGKFSLSSILPGFTGAALKHLNPQLQKINVETRPSTSLFIDTILGLTNEFPITIDVPYLSVQYSVKGTRVASVKLEGLKLGRGNTSASLSALLQFNKQASVADAVHSFVGALTGGPAVQTAISGISFGPSMEKAVTTFRQTEISFPVKLKLGQTSTGLISGTTTSGIGAAALGGIDIGGLDVFTTAQGIDLGLTLTSNQPIVNLNIGYLVIDLGLGKSRLVEASVEELVIRPGQQANLLIRLAFSRDKVDDSVAQLIDAIINKKPAQIKLSSIRLGASANDAIDAFTKFDFTVAVPSIGLPKSSNSAMLQLQDFKQIQIATTNYGVSVNVEALIDNPLPLSLNLGYLSIQLSTSSDKKMIELVARNLVLKRGQGTLGLDLELRLENGQDAATTAKNIVDAILKGSAADFKLGNIYFGINLKERFTLFSKVLLPIHLGQDFFNRGNQSATLALLPSFKSVDASTTQDGLKLKVGLEYQGFSLPLTLKVGYLKLGVSLNQHRLAAVSIYDLSLVNQKSFVELPVDLQLAPEDPEIPKQIADIVNAVLYGDEFKTLTISLSDLFLGSSKSSAFDIFSKIQYDYVIPGERLRSILGPLSSSNSELPAVEFSTVEDGLKLKLGLGPFNLPVSLHFGFVGVDLSLFGVPFSTVQLNNLELNKNSSLLLDSYLKLLPEDDKLKVVLAKFVNDILNGEDGSGVLTAGIKGLVFGSSQSSTFKLLSLVRYETSIPLFSSRRSLAASAFGLDKLQVDLNSMGKLQADVAFELGFLNGIIGDLGFLSVDIMSESVRFATLSALNTRIESGKLSSKFIFDLANGQEAAQVFARLVDNVFQGSGFVEITNVLFGFDSEKAFKGLSMVVAPIPILFGGSSKRIGAPINDLEAKFAFNPKGLAGSLKLELNQILSGGFKLDLGQLSASIGNSIGNLLYATLQVDEFILEQMKWSNELLADFNVPVNTGLQVELDKWIDTREIPFTITNIKLGEIDLFSKIAIPISALLKGGGNFNWTSLIRFYKVKPLIWKLAIELPFDLFPKIDVKVGSIAADLNNNQTKLAYAHVDNVHVVQGRNSVFLKASVQWFTTLWNFIKAIITGNIQGLLHKLTVTKIVANDLESNEMDWLTESLRGYTLRLGKIIQIFNDMGLLSNETSTSSRLEL